MTPILLFGVLALLSFGVLILMLRPRQRETDIERHLSRIGGLYAVEADGNTILKREVLSDIPWVNDLLLRLPGSRKVRRLIQQSGMIQWTVGQVVFGSCLAAWLVAWIGSLTAAPALAALGAGAAAGLCPALFLKFKRAARFHRFDATLPEAVDLMARALRAGHGVNSMIEMVAEEVAAPVGPEFRILFDEQRLGLPLREAMLNLAERVPLDDVRVLATAILVQKETGGNLAEILDKTAQLMRERMRLRGQLRIYTAQGRVTGWLLGGLPFGMFLMMNFLNHSYEKVLWTDPLGIDLLYAGLALITLGGLSIRKIVNIKV